MEGNANPSSPPVWSRAVDIALLRPDATREDVEAACAQVRAHGLHGVCVYTSRVQLAYSLLEDTEFKVTALIGFPLGAADSDAKRYETEVAVDHGAHEIETVLNLGRLKDGDEKYVVRELRDIAEAADERPVTAVLEMHLLSFDQIELACRLALDSGVEGVATGAGAASATVEEVRQLRGHVGDKFGVKAAGGIQETQMALALISASATRLAVLANHLPHLLA